MGVAPARMVQVLAEGVTLANFEGASLKSAPDASWLTAVRTARTRGARSGGGADAWRDDGRVLERRAHVCQRARQPPDAASLRRAGGALANGTGLTVDVLDETRITH